MATILEGTFLGYVFSGNLLRPSPPNPLPAWERGARIFTAKFVMDLLRSLPLGLYLEQPITWLHQLDSRVKFAWLMSFLAMPVLANPWWRIVLVGLLILLTLSAQIPLRVWKQQMGWLLLLTSCVFLLTAIAPDAMGATHTPRLPPDELAFAQTPTSPTAANSAQSNNPGKSDNPKSFSVAAQSASQNPKSSLPQPTSYRYILLEQGPITITRRSLDLGIRVGTLLFTLIYS
ncbi:MAG: CbiQ family ECF transporter T component, partial [Leptolyngbyaceae bacterium]|nr:CbiQ family ECF transporter T component [Leptolyngbyaceae bacterium]